MMPLNLMGSLIGAFMYVWLPDLILMSILTLLLFVLSIESIRKYLQMRNAEDKLEENKVKEAKATENVLKLDKIKEIEMIEVSP